MRDGKRVVPFALA